jgi:hypothetical protein
MKRDWRIDGRARERVGYKAGREGKNPSEETHG